MRFILRSVLLFFVFPLNIFAGTSISSENSNQYLLSICAIFQNEAPYFKEWIEFHKLQGVQHFFLYNNNSNDDYKQALQPYIDSKEVTLIEWPYTYTSGVPSEWLKIQAASYTNCIQNYGATSNWIAFIDIDEFLFCPTGEKLTAFLERHKAYGGVTASWLLFGTSSIETIPPNTLMIEVLTKCSLKDHGRNNRIKSIVQPQYVECAKNAHAFKYMPDYFAVNERGEKIYGGLGPKCHDQIRINHYWTRTEKHFRERKIQSRHNRRHCESAKRLRKMANSYNVSTDTAILQFVPELRKNMGYN